MFRGIFSGVVEEDEQGVGCPVAAPVWESGRRRFGGSSGGRSGLDLDWIDPVAPTADQPTREPRGHDSISPVQQRLPRPTDRRSQRLDSPSAQAGTGLMATYARLTMVRGKRPGQPSVP